MPKISPTRCRTKARRGLAHLGLVLAVLSLVASSCGGKENASPADADLEATEDAAEDDASTTTDEEAGTDASESPDSPDPDQDEDPDSAAAPEEEPPVVCPPDGDNDWGTSFTASTDWPTSSAATVLANTAIGAHDGYDRFVLTFGEQTEPLSWAVWVVDGQPVQDPSGLDLDIEGSEFLIVVVAGVAAYFLEPEDQYAGPTELDGVDAGTSNLVQAVLSGDFEAQVDWHIGYDQINAFRVFALESPPRLVVDMCVEDNAAG